MLFTRIILQAPAPPGGDDGRARHARPQEEEARLPHIYVYMYIWIERERERDTDR